MDQETLLTELSVLLPTLGQPIPPILFFETTSSTNQILWDNLAQGQSPPIAAIAAQQSAGRGQWGRHWQSELGGVYLSLALKVNLAARNGQQVTLWSAWGIAEMLRQRGIEVGLKWPNDLVLNGRKLGGIKCESKIIGNQIEQIVIGVGLNWANTVPDTGIALQSFLETQTEPKINSLESLAAIALAGLFLGYNRYCQDGVDAIINEYLRYFVNLNQSLEFAHSPAIVTGITAQGELKIKLSSSGASSEIIVPVGAIQLGYSPVEIA